MRVETVLMGLETGQYAGKGQEAITIGGIAEAARKIGALEYEGARRQSAACATEEIEL